MKRILILMLAVFSLAAQAQDPAASILKQIARTPFFAFGGVGDAGATSMGEAQFHMLMAQPRPVALQSFEKLFATGNGEAKAYALAGIRELNPPEFEQLMNAALRSSETINTMAGCIVGHERFAAVASRLKAGDYDHWIKRPESTSPGKLGGWVDRR